MGYTNAKNITKAYSYDGLGRLSTRTDGRNVTTNFAYDTSSRVNRVSRPFTVGGTVQEHITTFSYDSINNSSTRVLNNNQRTDYSYDSFGRVVQITENPLDAANMKITKFSFNNNNEVVLLQDPKNQPYVYEYDNQGNLTFEKLPENQKAYNTFDNQNNLISEQDYNQNIEQHDYDVKNNNTESIDPYVQSVSKRYNSLGNLLYQTNPMSVADNLLPNSGFEYGTTWPDFWTQVVQSGKTAQFAWSTITKFGNRSVSISNPTGWAIVHQIFDYAGGEPYVVSGYIKTANTTGRAYIKVEYFDLSMIWLGQRNSYGLIGTHDWTRLQTVITNVPAGTVKIRISFALDAGQGTAYYDAIQLEKGNVVSAYNLIENSSFERYSSPTEKIPLHWSTSGNLSTADGRYQLAESNDTRVYVGTQSIRLTGESGKNKYLAQRVLISGAALTKLTLSGWSYQEGANPVGGSFALQLGINHNDGTVDWQFKNEFSKTMQGWQHLSVEVEPTKSFQSIDVYLIYYNQTGLAWFDGLRLELGASHTSYVYDARNNYVTTIKDPLGNTINYSFDFFGNRTQQVEANGSTTIYSYNEVNELISVTDAKGFTTTYQYDGEGNITEVTNAKGDKQKYDYNQLNSLTKVTDALNRITSFEYDRFGNRTKTINADMSSVSNIFDNHNRLTSISYNNLKQFDLEYDLNDNLTKITRLNVPISTLTYDLNNRLISETESGKTTNYSYDDNSNITGLSIQGGSQINFVYNKLNLIRSILRNNAIVANYIYNESRQVSSVYFVNGTYAAYEYNGANQLIELTNYKINDLMDRYKYTYSPNGNIIRIETNSGTINYQYDQLNQLTQETFLDGTTISYEYDSVGNRTKKTVTASGTSTETTYIYNQVNQLISVNNQFIQYDLNGNMVDDGERIFVYNPDNRLIEVKVKTTGNTLAAFTYDFMGRRKTMTTTSGTVTFYYDQRDNVIYETDQSGTIHVEYTWDQENRPITMIKNGQTYYYHLNGHGDVIALTDKDGNIVASYSYNVWGIIISQSGTLSSTNPFRYAGYRYDENTNLYYLMARYYDSNIGRFISRDPYHELDEEPIALNLFAYSKNNPVKFMDRDGQNPVIAFAIGGALNSVPLLISYYSKHNNLRGFDWNRFYIAFLVGGITSVFGGAFYNLLKRAGANVISKIIGMGLYETKASILNTVSQGKKLTLTNVALNFTKGGALKGTGIVSRAWGIYKKSGLSGLQRFIGKIF
ncbi:RHS repeat protein [Bacillus sp. DNRA2]|nr:RHS repeat protein [Bacillus sp. DNRA2]